MAFVPYQKISNEAFKTEVILVSNINAGPVEILFTSALKATPHVFLGYTFTDALMNPILPSAGFITFEVKTKVNPEYSEAIFNAKDINATLVPRQLSFSGAAEQLIVTGSGITGAENVVIRINGFLSC